jgi:hypothetical protein
MAFGLPFTPTSQPTVGNTVKLTTNGATSVAGTIDCRSQPANTVLVTNGGTPAAGGDPGTGVVVFVRMSAEATPVATSADVPVLPGTSRIFANPVVNGISGIAVVSSGTTNCDVYFTPCEGGT